MQAKVTRRTVRDICTITAVDDTFGIELRFSGVGKDGALGWITSLGGDIQIHRVFRRGHEFIAGPFAAADLDQLMADVFASVRREI